MGIPLTAAWFVQEACGTALPQLLSPKGGWLCAQTVHFITAQNNPAQGLSPADHIDTRISPKSRVLGARGNACLSKDLSRGGRQAWSLTCRLVQTCSAKQAGITPSQWKAKQQKTGTRAGSFRNPLPRTALPLPSPR